MTVEEWIIEVSSRECPEFTEFEGNRVKICELTDEQCSYVRCPIKRGDD
jgi:hypothetical protein